MKSQCLEKNCSISAATALFSPTMKSKIFEWLKFLIKLCYLWAFSLQACLSFAFQRSTISAVAITWTAFLRWQEATAVTWTALSKALTSLSSLANWAWANTQTSSSNKRSIAIYLFSWVSLFWLCVWWLLEWNDSLTYGYAFTEYLLKPHNLFPPLRKMSSHFFIYCN